MNLSKHFSLDEFLHSQTATRLGIDNEPTTEQINNMIDLCEDVLESVRAHFGRPVIIDSGFRCKALNDAIPNSSKTSQHMIGEAADIIIPGVTLTDVLDFIVKNLEFDQCIFEQDWVHVSFHKGNNRKETLNATFDANGVHYSEYTGNK
jgi:zinc D-Ala-D-Ala carboxypeptidase